MNDRVSDMLTRDLPMDKHFDEFQRTAYHNQIEIKSLNQLPSI